jgi:Putative phage holin Dp-1
MTDTNPSITDDTTKFVLGEKMYARMKFFVQTLLPALSTLYFTLSGVWDLPYTTQVIGTLAAIATFLGVLLGISTKAYNNSDARFDGNVVVSQGEAGKTLYSLELKDEVFNKLDSAGIVTLKVGS